ncbi:hypothetical protein IWQ57_000599 [Coemansia nantahalensis]|uniref:Uncharacterized protein n=1 Tax=Coemansia nantahalensis TaxID=2789366 RepID=A0ACC1K837_9FUNG|nr:hypothetical protein IWQ57_000599 [Coemansia nantahalensis]
MVLKLAEASEGFGLAVHAARFAIQHRRVQRKFVEALKVTLLGMAAAHALIYVVVFLPLLVLRAGNTVLATALRYDATESTLALVSTGDAVSHFLSALPLLGLDVVIHLRPALFDGVFFAMLDEVDPEYAAALRSWPPRRFRWARIKYAAQRLGKRYLMTLGALVASRVPYVGWLVVPAGAVAMMARFVGYPTAGAIAAVSVIAPDSRRSTLFVFKSLLAMSGFSRDLLRPYFAHLGAKPEQQAAFYRANESTLVGFVLAFYFFVQLSWVGPAFFVLAQAAAALFVARQTERPPTYTQGAAWAFAARQQRKTD